MSCDVGLVIIGAEKGLPLKDVDYHVTIRNTIAEVEVAQLYDNSGSTVPIEVEYLFPSSLEACFTSLEIHTKDDVIRSKVEERNKASEIYEEKKEAGHLVAKGERDLVNSDIIRLKVGNIPPCQFIRAVFRYVENVELHYGRYYRLVISSTLTPRYQTRLKPNGSIPAQITNVKASDMPQHSWSIQIDIESPQKIEEILSPSHAIIKAIANEGHTAEVGLAATRCIPNRDFVLLFSRVKRDEPSALLTKYKLSDEEGERYCCHVSFLPESHEGPVPKTEDAEEQVKLAPGIQKELLDSRGEYIFIIDRSGSMDGVRIEKAKQALMYFLRSLPANSTFDIISFGKQSSMYSEESSVYNEETVGKALQFVEKMKADMGGTEILHPLGNALLKKKRRRDLPRYIFLLTDGEVSNTKEIIQMVRNNASKAIINTLGIGSGCSKELIVEVAKAGNGHSDFVLDNEDVSMKVIDLLAKSNLPTIDNIRLKVDQSLLDFATPDPNVERFIKLGELYHVFIFFNRKFTETVSKIALQFSYIHPQLQAMIEHTLLIDKSLAVDCDFIARFGAHNLIRHLERTFGSENPVGYDAYLAMKANEKLVLDLSLKFQVLCEQTSLLCVSKHKVISGHQPCEKVPIPNIESIDYYQQMSSPPAVNPKAATIIGRGTGTPKSFKKAANLDVFSFDQEFVSLPVSSSPVNSKLHLDCFSGFTYMPSAGHTVPPVQSSNQPTATQQHEIDEVDVVIKLMNFSGFWKRDAGLLHLLKIPEKSFETFIAEFFKAATVEDMQTLGMTLFVLHWLSTKMVNTEAKWKVIHQKGQRWIKSKGYDYQTLILSMSQL